MSILPHRGSAPRKVDLIPSASTSKNNRPVTRSETLARQIAFCRKIVSCADIKTMVIAVGIELSRKGNDKTNGLTYEALSWGHPDELDVPVKEFKQFFQELGDRLTFEKLELDRTHNNNTV